MRRSVAEASRRLAAKGVDIANANAPSVEEMTLDPAALNTTDATTLPPTNTLRARLAAFTHNNERLAHRLQTLQARSGSSELEGMYKKVVALCTGQEEERVPDMLEGLLVAMESEGGGGGNNGSGGGGNAGVNGNGEGGGEERIGEGKIREFLRKAEAV